MSLNIKIISKIKKTKKLLLNSKKKGLKTNRERTFSELQSNELKKTKTKQTSLKAQMADPISLKEPAAIQNEINIFMKLFFVLQFLTIFLFCFFQFLMTFWKSYFNWARRVHNFHLSTSHIWLQFLVWWHNVK